MDEGENIIPFRPKSKGGKEGSSVFKEAIIDPKLYQRIVSSDTILITLANGALSDNSHSFSRENIQGALSQAQETLKEIKNVIQRATEIIKTDSSFDNKAAFEKELAVLERALKSRLYLVAKVSDKFGIKS